MHKFDPDRALPTVEQNRRDYPVIGLLYGRQMYGTGTTHGFQDGFIEELTRGVSAAARERDCSLLLACGMHLLNPLSVRPAWPELAPGIDFLPVGPWNTDGLIVVHPVFDDARLQYLQRLQQSGFPVVHVGTSAGGPAIGMDNDSGVMQAVSHLIEHGHRRIAYVGGFQNDETGDSGQRLTVFRRAQREHGLSTDPRLVAFGQHRFDEGQAAMEQIIGSGVEFTAALFSNDTSAFGAMQALTDSGRRIPQDVAVIGFDDRPECAHSFPSLTSVHQPIFRRGYDAVGLLLDCIDGRPADQTTIVNVPLNLVVRRSCGCELLTVAGASANAPIDPIRDGDEFRTRLARTAMDAVLSETQQVSAGEMYQMLRRFVDAFIVGVEARKSDPFTAVMLSAFVRAEKMGVNMNTWTVAIGALERSSLLASFYESQGADAASFGAVLLQRTRVAIDESVGHQRWRKNYFSFDEHDFLAARFLLAANDETQIIKVLAEQLPNIGIPRSAFVLYEAQGDDPAAWSVMRTSFATEPVRFSTREFPPPGTFSRGEKSFRVALLPLLVQPGVSGYIALETDNLEACASIAHAITTALKSSKMYREAIEGRRIAEEANRLKSRFLSTVSHELRTPLSVILTASELLGIESDGKAEAGSQHTGRIRASAQHLDGLIRDVLDLAIDELGQLRLTYESLDPAAALKPVFVVAEQLARDKGLHWLADVPRRLPRVWGDRARLRQVALNLIANAVKFTPAGGEVILRLSDQGGSLGITVTDTGIGVPDEDRKIIFDDFHQSRRTIARGYGGLGLGLSICRRLVEMHGGEIGVRANDRSETGSTFVVNLPALQTDLDGVLQRDTSRGVVVVAGEGGHVDAGLLHRLAEKKIVVEQTSVVDIVGRLQREDASIPSPILMNAETLGTGGWQVIRQLKDHAATRDRPIVLYCFGRTDNAVTPADYLSKPIGTAELMHVLQREAGESPRAKTILVVDDDPDLLAMHASMIRSHFSACRVLTAASGREALELVRREHPDLILLDLMMPEKNGFEVLEEIQSLEMARHIPVIVLTAKSVSREELDRLGRSVTTVLAKGVFTAEETLAHIRQTIENDRPLAQEAQQLVRRSLAYIHEHYGRPLTRKKLADQVHVSEDHLTRSFGRILNMSPMTYLTRFRISRAKGLLDSEEATIADVATAVGFTSQFHFSDVFKKETGVSPSVYRRRVRTRL